MSSKTELNGLKKLIPYLFKHKLSLIIIFVLSLANAALALIPILFVGGIIDILTSGSSNLESWLPFIPPSTTIYIIGFALVYMLQKIISVINGHYISYFSNIIIYEVRQDAFCWSLYTLKPYRETKKTSDIISRLTGDVEAIMIAVAGPLNGLLPLLLKLIGSLIILMVWSRTIGIVAMILMALIYIASIEIAKKAKIIAKDQRESQANLLGATSDALNNIPIIKVFRSEKNEINIYKPYSKRILNLINKLQWSFSVYWNFVNILMCIGYVVTLIITIRDVKLGLLSVGSISIAYTYMTNILSPMVSISRYQNDLYQADAAISRVFELNDEYMENKRTEITSTKGLKNAPEIEFKNISIISNENNRIEDLSFRVKSNEILVLLGASGQGKSTILQTILNNHRVASGEILVNGDLLENTIKDLYPSIGVSFQESYLFDRTIKENIAYFSEEFDENRLNLITKSLRLNEIIDERGLDFYVGLNGKNLSGGERRRVSLARALYAKDKSLYLFDEPTSELDDESRKLVVELLKELKTSATIIITTHDKDLLDIADVVIDLNEYSEKIEIDD